MVIIYLWKKSEQSEMGHVAMLISAGDAEKKQYVSWYPKEDVGFAFIFKQEICVHGKAYRSIGEEIKQSWNGKKPDAAVSIEGLNEAKMKKDWESLKNEDQWCLAKRNCATVVYMLLRAGGAPKVEDLKNLDIDKLQFSEVDHLASKIALIAGGAWTPIRAYNYANAVAFIKKKQLKSKVNKAAAPKGTQKVGK